MQNGAPHTNQSSGDPPKVEESSFLKFKKYWWLVRRKIWLLILFALIGAGYKYDQISKVKEIYRSMATVLLDGSSTDRAYSLLGVPGARYGYDNELIILRSDKLASQVAQSLLKNFEASGKLDTLEVLKNSSGGIHNIEVVASRAKRSVTFSPGNEKQSIIRIYATAYAPIEASILANTYAYTYKANNVRTSVSQITEASKYITDKIEEVNDSLLKTEYKILNFFKEYGFSKSELSSESLINQLTVLYQELDKARIELVSNKEEILAIDSTLSFSRNNETDILLGATDNLIGFYQDQIQKLTIEKEEELNKLTNASKDTTNNIISNINAKLERSKSKLNQLIDRKLSSSSLLSSIDGSVAKYWVELNARRTELINLNRALPKKISNIKQQISYYEDQLDSIPILEMELDKLKRRRQNYFAMIEQFTTKQVEIELAEVSEGGYVSVLDPAKPNYQPINKQKLAGVFQGAILGLLLATFLIIGLDRIDDRIKSDVDIRELGHNIISTIPEMNTIIQKDFNDKKFIEYKGAFISTKLISLLSPLSGISEMYRRLRTYFLFSNPDKRNKSILVSSSNPQEGKSISASNLASVLANSGKQVVLVDADLRRPNLDIVFGINKSPGLTDVIIDDFDIEQIIKPTVVDNLFLIPAGTQVPNPSEILGSDSFKNIFKTINSEFDYVVIDSPPLNSVVDAVTIAELIDQILIVIKVGSTKKREIRQSLELLSVVENKIAGFLLNSLDGSSYISEYNYYQNYNYYGNSASSNSKVAESKTDKIRF